MIPRRTRAGIDGIFRAFSDRTRLRILHVLKDGELCVGDIVEALRIRQARASRHLAYLRRAGLVVTREVGLWSFYSLAPARRRLHRKLLECLAACGGDVPEFGRDLDRARTARKSGGCCPR
jgi:ArsR family transcriptional regulator